MARTAGKTGILPIALVAVEQYYPQAQRIIDDGLAGRLLPLGARMFVRLLQASPIREWVVKASEKSNPGIWGGLLCRKCYIDEKLLASRPEMEAIVNLGAGFDTRLYRLPCLAALPAWEIDQRDNIDRKAHLLRRALGATPGNVRLVAVDFDREDLGAVLAREGYSASKRTFFIWEAVSQYLTEQGVRATFDFLARAARGSRLAFTYVRKDFLDGTALYGWPGGYKQFVESKLWLFGMTPETCPAFAAHYGWRVVEDIGYDELANRYIRPSGRRLSSTPIERMVYAEKRT
jgi:methyltransferase (TIGR00027 family)